MSEFLGMKRWIQSQLNFRKSPLTIPKLMLNAAGGNLSIRYGIRGPNYTVATACASATNAIGLTLIPMANTIVPKTGL